MARPLQTVTCSFPILVDWGPEDPVDDAQEMAKVHAGRPTFPSDSMFVREVRQEDIAAWLTGRAAKGAPKRITQAQELKRALGRMDDSVIRGVLEKVRSAVPDYIEIPKWVLEIDTKKRTATRRDLGVNWGATAVANYGNLIADKFKNVRLVMWYSERSARVLPALYCPDWETAALVFALVGGYQGIQVCTFRNCDKVFSPEPGQLYCCDRHGNAERQARLNDKRRAEKRKRQEKTRGRSRLVEKGRKSLR